MKKLAVFAAVAVATPGILRDVSVYFWKAGPLRTWRIDDRFAGIARAVGEVPRAERLGFVTDAAGEAAASRYYDALYALAPRILLQKADAPFVVADLEDPARIDAICAQRRLHVLARGSSGVALLERD